MKVNNLKEITEISEIHEYAEHRETTPQNINNLVLEFPVVKQKYTDLIEELKQAQSDSEMSWDTQIQNETI